ncbi:MAG: hypothetical protein IPL35_04790 [Sphingobacteriales bacterium]|nr:hypothetical protein [Sphingobacteriales bacterium]
MIIRLLLPGCGQPYIPSVTVSPAVTPTFTPMDPLSSSSGVLVLHHEQRSDGDVESCEYQSGHANSLSLPPSLRAAILVRKALQ